MGGGNMGMGGMNPGPGGMGMSGMGGGMNNMVPMNGMGMGEMVSPNSNPRMMGQGQQQPGGGMGPPPSGMMSPPGMGVGLNVGGPSVGGMGGMMNIGMQGQGMGMGGGMGNMGMGGGGGGGGMGGQNAGMMGGMAGTGGGLPQGGIGAGGQQQHPQSVMNPSLGQVLYSILKNPAHPMMKFMLQNVPGFESLPVPQQMQRLMAARVGIRLILFRLADVFRLLERSDEESRATATASACCSAGSGGGRTDELHDGSSRNERRPHSCYAGCSAATTTPTSRYGSWKHGYGQRQHGRWNGNGNCCWDDGPARPTIERDHDVAFDIASGHDGYGWCWHGHGC